jgi:hypothetical protein
MTAPASGADSAREPSTSARALLRHTVATLSYRAAKALSAAPSGFAEYRVGPASRTPSQILAHMGDLFDWALHMARGAHVWHNSRPLAWDDEVVRFFEALRRFDEFLASDAALGCEEERLFQGPVADALTHTGQLTMLRRLAGAPVRGENYARAGIAAGRISLENPGPRAEFD